ncbi:MAG: hypothetical protein PHC62_00195 [Candidatus Izemoplasmatales bacterium]|nr:hypothetical protein [Candidatus Izemoplasmatales bacterium]
MADLKIYTKKPNNYAEYTRMRGVTDFSNAKQFNIYESGYAFLVIISKPAFMEKLAVKGGSGGDVERLLNAFCHILENEFRGLEGIEDITAENITFTDGISEMNSIGKVVQQSGDEVSMTFTEKSGSIITRFIEYYLKGIKDPRTQAKTYHGLIADGDMSAGFENEVFNMMYIVTDSTMLSLEKAYLLCNAWPTKATTSIYNTTKGDIGNKEIDVSFQCFIIDNEEVNKRANQLLAYITGNATSNKNSAVYNVANSLSNDSIKGEAKKVTSYLPSSEKVALSSNDYDYYAYTEGTNGNTNSGGPLTQFLKDTQATSGSST